MAWALEKITSSQKQRLNEMTNDARTYCKTASRFFSKLTMTDNMKTGGL